MTKSQNIAKKFCKESELLEPVAKFATREGFSLQVAELPFYEYSIDLYGFCRKQNSTIAIELKLSNWKRALRQAILYQLCSDFVYIAMPESSTKRVDLDALRENAIGLIAVRDSGRCDFVLPAGQHKEVRSFYRGLQIDYLKEKIDA
jgi:hypothetical protein